MLDPLVLVLLNLMQIVVLSLVELSHGMPVAHCLRRLAPAFFILFLLLAFKLLRESRFLLSHIRVAISWFTTRNDHVIEVNVGSGARRTKRDVSS